MFPVLVIAAFVAIVLRDDLAGPPLAGGIGPLWASGLTIGGLLAVWLVAHATIRALSAAVDRSGRVALVGAAELVLATSRIALVAVHATGVLALGWLDAVRAGLGDLWMVDEVVAVAPVLGLLAAGWASIYGLERRVWEASLVRQLDEGGPVRPILTRRQFVLQGLRHQLALAGLPVLLILGWGEGVERLAARVAGGTGRERPAVELIVVGAQLAGVIGIFGLLPLAMRRIWDTVRLTADPMRAHLLALCRAHRVRVRDLLVWRTHGTVVNAAVMGLVGPARFILLSDALLEALPPRQVEAVTAHEVGHVRRGHMVWLAASVVATVLIASVGLEWLLRALPASIGRAGPAEAAATALALGAGLVALGIASRRFEWQADAFAVQHLSGWRSGRRSDATISEEAVAAMVGALETVAVLNHVPPRRYSWRHGSIASRQARLRRLVGRRADRVGADRAAGAVKLASVAALAVVLGVVARDAGWW